MARVKGGKRPEEASDDPGGVEGLPRAALAPVPKGQEQQLHSMTYAYRGSSCAQGEFRKLWISRINAAARLNDITYNRFIHQAAGVEVDRKVLSLAEIAP